MNNSIAALGSDAGKTYTHQVYDRIIVDQDWNSLRKTGDNLDTIELVQRWEALAGIVPHLNNNWGPVVGVMEELAGHMLHGTSMRDIWMHQLKIDHVLAALPWTRIEDITRVSSHEQAMRQCRDWLEGMWANVDAICRGDHETPDIDNTQQMYFKIADRPWSLHDVLDQFKSHHVSLLHIRSIPNGNDEYVFSTRIPSSMDQEYLRDILNHVGWEIMPIPDLHEADDAVWQKVTLNPTASNNTMIDSLWETDAIISDRKSVESRGLEVLQDHFAWENNYTTFSVLTKYPNDSPKAFAHLQKKKIIWLLSVPDGLWRLSDSLWIIKDAWLSLSYLLSVQMKEEWSHFSVVLDNPKDPDEIRKTEQQVEQTGWRLVTL